MHSQNQKVAVVGAGVIGLTSALQLRQAGYQVDVFFREKGSPKVSTIAGGYWWPHKAYPPERVARWSKAAYEYYRTLKDNPESGIHFRTHYRFCLDPDECAYVLDLVDNYEVFDGKARGVDCEVAYKVEVPVINVPVYMPYLEGQAHHAGISFIPKDLQSLSELADAYDCIVNCSGLGARELVGDHSVYPIRGQVVVVPSETLGTESYRVYSRNGPLTLILPRGKDCVLGGTSQENDWNLSPREEDTHAILERCSQLIPELARLPILEIKVGLRPGRSEIRLECEKRPDGPPVVHNYGHGGAGFTVAWGCAQEVCQLVRETLSP